MEGKGRGQEAKETKGAGMQITPKCHVTGGRIYRSPLIFVSVMKKIF